MSVESLHPDTEPHTKGAACALKRVTACANDVVAVPTRDQIATTQALRAAENEGWKIAESGD